MPKRRRGDEKVYRYGKIFKYDKQGNFVKEFDSYNSCWELDNISAGHLWDILNGGKTKRIKGHIYSYDYYLKFPIKEKLIDGRKKGVGAIKIYQYDLDGNFIKEWTSAAEAHRTLKLNRALINSSSKSNFKRTAGGFLWSRELIENVDKFKKESHRNKSVSQYDLDNKLIYTFKSAADAHKITGVKRTKISHCANGRQKTAGGFIWKFKE